MAAPGGDAGQLQKYLRQSVEDLINKAAIDPYSLTYAKCRLMKDDFHVLGIMDELKHASDRRHWMRARPDLQAKQEQARTAVLSPMESKAFETLEDMFYSILTAHYDAREEKRRHERPRHLPQ
ncbi:hypothetical protein BDV41DRAFT_572615 [Aspergillus transmontanensis]|uniref:Uncharacterized protein n=1 Tax=Aspergillus transmontanensis TaxID=1034304 RepID=A0A5N6WBE1_9EURO|nr:hypothetical protein BDV41DRAFT_572615 [Aspergillus transmontanensis]